MVKLFLLSRAATAECAMKENANKNPLDPNLDEKETHTHISTTWKNN